MHSTRAKARFKDVTECVPSALVSRSSGIDESMRSTLSYMVDLSIRARLYDEYGGRERQKRV